MEEFEKFLAPWEKDTEGKALAEPAELDAEKLKKYLYNLLSDKEKLQETVADKDTEIATVQESLATVQREHEDDAARLEREQKEREARYTKLEQAAAERARLDAALAVKDITPARARRLAARLTGDDAKAFDAQIKDIIEDGFKINDKPAGEQVVVPDEEHEDDLTSRPVRRSDGTPVIVKSKKPRSVAEEVAAAIPISTW